MPESLVLILILLAAGALGLAAFLYGIPLVLRASQVRRWKSGTENLLALTFDDGPDPTTTPAVLDLLDELEAPATFYLVGFRTRSAPEVLRRLSESRHQLGTHTHSHKNAWKIGPFKEHTDALRGYETLGTAVPPDAAYRPPFGKSSLPTVVAMRRRRRPVHWWTVAANDTRNDLPDPRSAAESILESGGPVVLMHCHHAEPDRRAFVLNLTRELINGARERGRTLVTMESLEEATA